ncbi:hypothetical protein J1614_003786, partial [Plenodomus biglobosus]
MRICPDSRITAIYPSRCRDVASIDDRLSFPNPYCRQTTLCCHGSSLSRHGGTPPGPVQLHCHDPRITFILTLKPCRRFQLQKVNKSAKGSTGRGFLNQVVLCVDSKIPQIPCRLSHLADTGIAGPLLCRLEASSASHLICSCCNSQSWTPAAVLHSCRLIGTLATIACILHFAVSSLHSADQWLHSTAGFSRVRPIVDMLGYAR